MRNMRLSYLCTYDQCQLYRAPGACANSKDNYAPVPRYAGTRVFCQMASACHITGVTTIHIKEYIVTLG